MPPPASACFRTAHAAAVAHRNCPAVEIPSENPNDEARQRKRRRKARWVGGAVGDIATAESSQGTEESGVARYFRCLDGFLESSRHVERQACQLLEAAKIGDTVLLKDGEIQLLEDLLAKLTRFKNTVEVRPDTGLSLLLGGSRVKAGLSGRYSDSSMRSSIVSSDPGSSGVVGSSASLSDAQSLGSSAATSDKLTASSQHTGYALSPAGKLSENVRGAKAAGARAGESPAARTPRGTGAGEADSSVHLPLKYHPALTLKDLETDSAPSPKGVAVFPSSSGTPKAGLAHSRTTPGDNSDAAKRGASVSPRSAIPMAASALPPSATKAERKPAAAKVPGKEVRVAAKAAGDSGAKADRKGLGKAAPKAEPAAKTEAAGGTKAGKPAKPITKVDAETAKAAKSSIESETKRPVTDVKSLKAVPPAAVKVTKVIAVRSQSMPKASATAKAAQSPAKPAQAKAKTNADSEAGGDSAPPSRGSSTPVVTEAMKPEDTKSVDTKAEDTKAEDTKAEETKSESMAKQTSDDSVEQSPASRTRAAQKRQGDKGASAVPEAKKSRVTGSKSFQYASDLTPETPTGKGAASSSKADSGKAKGQAVKRGIEKKAASPSKAKVDAIASTRTPTKSAEKAGAKAVAKAPAKSPTKTTKSPSSTPTKAPRDADKSPGKAANSPSKGKRSGKKDTPLISYTGKRKDDIEQRLMKAAIYYEKGSQFFDYIDDPREEDLTHLVAPFDVQKPTLKVLYAICQGAFILTPDYLEEAERTEKWPSEVGFEHPRWPMRATRPRPVTLMRNMKLYPVAEGKKLNMLDLTKLVALCGGAVVNTAEEATHYVVPEDADLASLGVKTVPPNVTVVTENWVVRVIERMVLLPSDLPKTQLAKLKTT
ncbi:BRCA1 C Terminus (BRCT) domain containing protein, putative [Babesia caballi]|uniref:BRCA1 C Terminus (BRCT) domain containing protein, putative n=1 Tax=Babesia caballi TaxID=5871 RepID=A0AAV4LYY6_BABCB|nr:BRCA1 C Terminus (BRCT) domain containing protein, putative [Babesia caballi]